MNNKMYNGTPIEVLEKETTTKTDDILLDLDILEKIIRHRLIGYPVEIKEVINNIRRKLKNE